MRRIANPRRRFGSVAITAMLSLTVSGVAHAVPLTPDPIPTPTLDPSTIKELEANQDVPSLDPSVEVEGSELPSSPSAPATTSGAVQSLQEEPAPVCPEPEEGADPPTEPLNCIAVQVLSPPSVPGTATPKMSNRPNGTEIAAHVTAVISRAPEGTEVEAFVEPSGGTRRSIGNMNQVSGSSDTWMLPWTIPAAFEKGNATISIEAKGPDGHDVGKDSVGVSLQHKDDPQSAVPPSVSGARPAAETAAITWPTQGGPLGFYKAPGGRWETVITGILSTGANASDSFDLYYSVTPIGVDPVFTGCTQGSKATTPNDDEEALRPFQGRCRLAEDDTPSRVTAVAAIPRRNDPSATSLSGSPATQAATAHRVAPFIQVAGDMNVELTEVTPTNLSANQPSGKRRLAGNGCLDVTARVTDQFGQPVQGANIDAQVIGPTGAVAFGSGGSSFRVPAGIPEEDASNCSGGTAQKQGRATFEDGRVMKRIESVEGSGLPGGGIGEWRMRVFTPAEAFGFSDLFVWVDEEPRHDETGDPEHGNNVLDGGEPSAALRLQWLERAAALTITPANDSFPTDSCARHIITAAGGRSLMRGVNVDLHLRGPRAEQLFCKVPGVADLRVPDRGDHGTEEAPSEDTHPANTRNVCPGEGQPCLHREGETDSQGRLIVGLSSNAAGTTTIRAWLDGEAGHDDDLDNVAALAADASTSWIKSDGDVKLAFANPSSHLGSRGVGAGQETYLISLTADAPYQVKAIDLEVAQGDNRVELGRAEQVAGSGTYQFLWDLEQGPFPGAEEPGPVPDGSYTIRARIPGTSISVDSPALTVKRVGTPFTDPPWQWARIEAPGNGRSAIFDPDGKVAVTGVASAGTEAVDLYYSRGLPGRDRQGTWTSCGPEVVLSGTGTEEQTFEAACTLASGHRFDQVTAIAAVPYNCAVDGCVAATGRRVGGGAQGGSAVAVTGCASSPCVTVTPGRWQTKVGRCVAAFVDAVDTTGQPLSGRSVEVTAEGPGNKVSFCNPDAKGNPSDGGSRRATMTGTTDSDGYLSFGVVSHDASFKDIFSAIEHGVTTVSARLVGDGGSEVTSGEVHWSLPGRCTLIGTPGDDVLVASSFPSKICGLGGNDVIYGLDGLTGNDTILGGPGNDIIFAQRGNDTVKGGHGNDSILGGPGDDRLYGQAGTDEIFGEAGNDIIIGGRGRDGCTAKNRKGQGSVKGCFRSARKTKDVKNPPQSSPEPSPSPSPSPSG